MLELRLVEVRVAASRKIPISIGLLGSTSDHTAGAGSILCHVDDSAAVRQISSYARRPLSAAAWVALIEA